MHSGKVVPGRPRGMGLLPRGSAPVCQMKKQDKLRQIEQDNKQVEQTKEGDQLLRLRRLNHSKRDTKWLSLVSVRVLPHSTL